MNHVIKSYMNSIRITLYLGCNEVAEKKGQRQQQDADAVASQVLSSVFVHIHVYEMSSIRWGYLKHWRVRVQRTQSIPKARPNTSQHLIRHQWPRWWQVELRGTEHLVEPVHWWRKDVLAIYSDEKLVQFLSGTACRHIQVLCKTECILWSQFMLDLSLHGLNLVMRFVIKSN